LQAKPSLSRVHESFSTGHRPQLLSHNPCGNGKTRMRVRDTISMHMLTDGCNTILRTMKGLPASFPPPPPTSQPETVSVLEEHGIALPRAPGPQLQDHGMHIPDVGDQRKLNCLTLLFSCTVSKVVGYRLDLTHRGVFFGLNIVGSFVFP
jgi:hypothetical protein